MKTENWTIKRIKNPHPKKWPGPWFSFKRDGEEGQANWRTLHSYIGWHDWQRVEVRFRKTFLRFFENFR